MKVAFISANREILPDPVHPLGLLYLIANLHPRHKSQLWDLCHEEDPFAYLTECFKTWEPDVVAIGLRNVQNSLYSDSSEQIEWYALLIAQIRHLTKVPVIIGGSGFSVIPEAMMERLKPDFGISGESEVSLNLLLDALEQGQDPKVPGLFSSTCAISRGIYLDLDTIKTPDRSILDPRYSSKGAMISIQTRRGCSFSCSYCTYPKIEGKRVRFRSPQNVVDEMLALADGLDTNEHFFIVDSVFNNPSTHAKELCRLLADNGWKHPWTCYLTPRHFDLELAELMARANCIGVEIGSDSGTEKGLLNFNKGFTLDQVKAASTICRSVNIKDCHTFVLAGLGETLDDVRLSLDFIEELDPFAAIIMLWVDDKEAADPALLLARRDLRDLASKLILERIPKNKRWIVPQVRVAFSKRLFGVLRKMGLKGPLWQYIDRA